MRSDVPVGVSLWGGLDSSSILCAADRVRRQGDGTGGQPLRAFCYMAPEFDESVYIDDVLAQTGANLQRLETNPKDLWERLPEVLRYHDEPVHSLTAAVGFDLIGLASQTGMRIISNREG